MDLPAVDDVALVKSIADDLPVAIWLGTVPKGDVVYVNRAFEEILGMGPPDGAERGNYVAPYGIFTRDGSPYPEGQMPYERVLRARDTVVIDDLVIHRGDKRIALRVFAKPLFDDKGEITHVLEAFHDISREVEAERARTEGEARLRQAQRMEAIGNLAGGIAHDFNNMLAAIKILTSHLERSEADKIRLQLLGDIGSVVDTASKLTRALLRFARRGEAVVQPVSIAELVTQVAELGRRTIDRNIEIVNEAEGSATVLGDPAQIEQVLMNLVVNARDAMPSGGRLCLRTRNFELGSPRGALSAGKYVEIEVADNGTGIAPEIRDRVFDPYFTTKTTGPVKGTGLGLATVYAIVSTHGGAVEIVDTLGGGTTVRVMLPRADAAHAASAAAQKKRETTPRQGTLLFVDDEAPIRRATVIAFEALGYRVLSAEHGEEAVEIFRRMHAEIDAVVLDMVMPGMGGRAALRVMNGIAPEVPVILTSGLALDGEGTGAHAFAAKPYDIDSLCETIERLRTERLVTRV
jgi:signal transduction histidine kinase/CheY-like chemotaxis protein